VGVARPAILGEPAELGARRIGLELLAKVRAARDRLDDPSDRHALHDFRVALRRLRSWLRAAGPQLRDTLRHKTERRLARIAHVTGTSRDLEVHIAWAKRARRDIPHRARPGAEWLLRHLRGLKKDADAELREVIDRDFTKAVRQTGRALEQYMARVADDGPRFGEIASALVAREAAAFQTAVRQVSGQGHRAEAHAARIATKRLRYALEDLASVGVQVGSITDELKQLQDTLGELHDAQQFGIELATMTSNLVADRPPARHETGRARQRRAAKADPVVGLRTMLKQLRRTETKAFRAFQRSWQTDEWGESLTVRLATIERSLR
jgi:CHAD domain-containing protein